MPLDLDTRIVCIGRDSSPASFHESLLKQTWLELVSTLRNRDNMVSSGMETRPTELNE
jgi:hypothetical protein